ncbi:MAG: B12-binding domain-containing radical SAM protein [Candidatus Lokiarchaeota archaeon]|nr:B12-binding domain-containing radical SAM protein [Candidatus Lokiarchaeota archaeon]
MISHQNNLMFLVPSYFFIEDYQKHLYFNDIPLGTLQLSTWLKERAGTRTGIVDLRIESEKLTNIASKNPFNDDRVKKELIEILERNQIAEFDNVGINCYTSYQYAYSVFVAQVIKEEYPDKVLIVGGYHPTAVPHDFLYDGSPFDYLIRGEGELALLNLFARDKPLVKNINLYCRELYSNELVDINQIPFPDFDTYLKKYPYKNKFNFEIYASRGCPYQCAFCATNYPFRSLDFSRFKIQFEKLIPIVEELGNRALKIGFVDQAFCNVPIYPKILEYIHENRLHEQFSFSCQARVESLAQDLNMLRMLRKCEFLVGVGFESANPLILKEMHKTGNPINYIGASLKILNEYKNSDGPYVRFNVVCGFPGETKETFKETVDFIHQYAIHENVQISPSLFSNYPNVFVYKNMDYYEREFGAKFVREWWKMAENQFKLSVPEPSERYSLKDLIQDYKTEYTSILKLFRRNTFGNLLLWKDFYNKWHKELDASSDAN